MTRRLYYFTSSRHSERAFRRYFAWFREGFIVYTLIVKNQSDNFGENSDQTKKDLNALETFREISLFLEHHQFNKITDAVGILDIGFLEFGVKSLNPLIRKTSDRYEQLVTLLILAFPEIHWVFRTLSADEDWKLNTWSFQEILPSFIKRISDNHLSTPLFDRNGLRNQLRLSILEQETTKKLAPDLTIRKKSAAAIDDETSYAYMFGYVAYRLGYLCHAITSQASMEYLFRITDETENMADRKSDKMIDLTFEDLYINFPDWHVPEGVSENQFHLSDIMKRDKVFRRLTHVKKRVLVTVGHSKSMLLSKCYPDRLDNTGGKAQEITMILKPCGGFYDVVSKSGLQDVYKQWLENESIIDSFDKGHQDIRTHSAPGRLLMVSTLLLQRARTILCCSVNVQECIHGALLALEAKELLGYRTPTTTMEAITLRHQLEVKAECMFYGTEYNMDVKNRFKELKDEINTTSKWFNFRSRKRSSLNAQMGIVMEIMRIFREFGRFDEEQICLNYFRKIKRKLYFSKTPWLYFLRPIRAYVERLVGSLTLFILALFLWPFIFATIAILSDIDLGNLQVSGPVDFEGYITYSFITFYGLYPVCLPEQNAGRILIMLMILFGFIHLGVFIAHLYTLVSRK